MILLLLMDRFLMLSFLLALDKCINMMHHYMYVIA